MLKISAFDCFHKLSLSTLYRFLHDKNFFPECLSESMLAKLAVAELEALNPVEVHIICSVEIFFKS